MKVVVLQQVVLSTCFRSRQGVVGHHLGRRLRGTKSETGGQLLHPQLEGVILSELRHQSQLLHLKVESFAEKKHIIKDRRILQAVERYYPETVELVEYLDSMRNVM